MPKWTLVKRVLWVLPVVVGVASLTFFLTRMVSSDPTASFVPPNADEGERAAVRAKYGLDKPVVEQYGIFLIDAAQGELGNSFMTGRPVSSDLSDRLPATVELAAVAVVGGAILGVAVGVASAVWRDRWPDLLIRGVTLGGLALPSFWVGLMLLWIFYVVLGVLPGPVGRLPIGVAPPDHVTGFYLIDSLLQGDLALLRVAALQMLLPATTLGVAVMAPVSRVTRGSMIEALQSDYIRTAVAMGHHRRTIWFRYALKNSAFPVVTMIGGVIGFSFAGAVLVEGIFAWPGTGFYALNAIKQGDYPALQGFVLYAAVLYVVVYLAVDVIYHLIDPRMRGAKA